MALTSRRSCAALVVVVAVAYGTTTAGSSRAARPAAPTAPRLLTETGLYSDAARLVVDPRHRPYAPQYPLWSDGAVKTRWMSLPPGTTIDVTHVDAWVFPVGTKFWKEFAVAGQIGRAHV